jgi:ubiquitin C-terminal hydrolase
LDLNNILNNPTLPENYYKNLSDNDLITYNLPKVLDTKESYHYNMIGMILHHGKIGSGHYTALFKDGDWWEYNDQEASRRNIQDVLNETITMEKVYILLYERVS